MANQVQEYQTMKEQLTDLVNNMQKDGFDFKATPPVFKWNYEELPNIEFQLLIKAVE